MKHNVYFSSNDLVETEVFRFQFTVTATFTPAAQGVEITVGTTTATSQHVGQIVVVADSGKPSWYGIITHIISSTKIFVVPYQSATDSVGNIFQLYSTSTTVTSDLQIHNTLSIDLSDAPDGTYNYIIASSCGVAGLGTSVLVRPQMLSACKPGDPFYHDKSAAGLQRFQGRYHFKNGSYIASRETLEDTYMYNTVHSVSLTPGNIYEFHIAAECPSASSGASAWLRNGSIVAFRVNTFQELDKSTDSSGVDNSTATYTNGGSNSITLSTTDNYMFLFCAAGKHDSTSSGGCQLRFRVGATTYADTTFLPANINNNISFGGWLKLDSVASGTVVQIEVANNSSGTANLSRWYICAIPLSTQTGYGFDYTNSGLLADDKKTDTDSTATMKWNEGRTSATVTQTNRKYIEVITTNARKASGDARCFARPFFRNGLSVGCADRGYVGPGLQWNGFWVQRTNPYLNGTTTNGIETKAAVSEGINVKLKNSHFLFLPEQDELIPDEITETTIIADVESGLQYKTWNTHTTDVYKRQISDITQVSRVLRNSVELSQLTTKPANTTVWGTTPTDSYYWDMSEKTMYIKVPSNPANDDQTVLVVALDTYGRNAEVLYDTSGTLIPYEPRLMKVPGLQQEIEARGTQSQVSTTLGSISLPASDRAFDRKVTRRIYEGLRATIRRGYSSLSKSLDTFHVVAKGIMGMPKLDEGKFEIKLYDTGLTLNRALDDNIISVYRGSALTEGQALPIIYGTLKRVPAYRVTDLLGSGTVRNTYKIAANFLVSIDNVYLDGTSTLQPGDTGTNSNAVGTKYPASAAFLGPSYNNGGANPNAGWNADVLYVDVTGLTIDNVYTGTLLTKPGEIAKHLLQNYPRVKTDVTGGFATANVTAGFSQVAAPFDITVDTNAAFSIGDVIKVREGSNKFYAYVYAKPSGKLSVATLYRAGDSTPGSTSYTTAADVDLVEKSGGLPDKGLHHESFRLVDRKWRKKLSGGILTRRNTPTIGLVLTGTESVASALNKISQYTFTYWYVNRLGRVAMGVPDFDGSNLIENPGFENFSSIGVWPHKSICNNSSRTSMGNVTLTSAKKYEGLSSVKVENKNGSFEAVPNCREVAPIILPSPGTYAVTALVALESGNGSAVRIGISSPNDNRLMAISEPVQAVNEEWRRVTTYITTGRGNAGLSYLRLLPYNPDLPSPPNLGTGASLAHWYKADEPNSGYDIPKDNTVLSTWYDKGTNPVNLTSSGGPRYIKDYCLGRPGVFYDSVNDHHASFSPGSYTQYTLFVVYALNDSYTGGRRVACGTLGSGGDEVYIGVESGATTYTAKITDGTGNTFSGSESLASNINTLKIHTLVVTGTSTKYFINGVQQGATDSTRKPITDTLFLIGYSSGQLNGVVCEVMMYDRGLNSSGRAAVENYLRQKYSIDAAGIYMDNVEVSRVAGVIDDNTADSLPLEFRDEIYPEARVTYNVNLQDTSYASAIILTDSAAKGLTSTVSEGKNAIQTSARLDLGTPTITDSASASGIAAALVAYFGRLRYTTKIKMLCPYDFIPDVGMKLLNMGMTRLPAPNDDYPLFPITSVDYNEENAIQLDLSIEAQVDPVLDRGNIAQDSMPLGTVLVTLDTGSPSYVGQFEEITETYDRFIAGSSIVDLITENGNTYHTHTGDHTHNISNHTHTFSVDTIGIEDIFYQDISMIDAIGPRDYFSRGYDNGSHNHTGSQSGITSTATSGSSGGTSVTTTTPPGPNTPAFIRARFFRHILDNLSDYIPQTLYFMYESNSVPTGWTRNTSFNGYFLRGATTNTAISGRPISGNFTPTDTGSYLTFTTAAHIEDMQRGKRLTVVNTTSGTKTFHVVVDSVDDVGNRVWVYPLHEDGDTPNVLIGSTNTTVAADTEIAGTTFSSPNHDHDNTIPSHSHTANHTHNGAPSLITGAAPESAQAFHGTYAGAATVSHQHTIKAADFPSTPGGTVSSAAGSTFTDTKPVPDGYGLIFMSSPASNRLIPSGAIIFFDGAACPTGWTRYGNADNLLIYGATGSSAGAITGGHTHTFTAASHTFSHNHGGTFTSTTDMVDIPGYINYNIESLDAKVSPYPHHHTVTGTINTNGSATLESKTLVNTSAASSKQPPFKKLLLCKKD